MAAESVPFDKPDRAAKPCPICGKPAIEAVAPFCSKRCADIDLHKWLKGAYAVPDDAPGEPEPPPDGGAKE